jgi:hypothetical protein
MKKRLFVKNELTLFQPVEIDEKNKFFPCDRIIQKREAIATFHLKLNQKAIAFHKLEKRSPLHPQTLISAIAQL